MCTCNGKLKDPNKCAHSTQFLPTIVIPTGMHCVNMSICMFVIYIICIHVRAYVGYAYACKYVFISVRPALSYDGSGNKLYTQRVIIITFHKFCY